MLRKLYKIEIFKGDDTPIAINLTVNYDTPLDITGYKFFFTLKGAEKDTDANALAQIDWTVHSNPSQGATELIIPASATTDLKAGQYYLDIKFKTPTGSVRTVIKGQAEIIEQVTVRST